MSVKIFFLPVFILLLFAAAAAGEGQELEERSLLLEQQRLLESRIEQLKREQDELLFLKTISATDSKYLVLKLSLGTGQLRYKNRILKEFQFQTGTGSRPEQGAAVLTKKREEPKSRRALLFGTSLIMLQKNTMRNTTGILPLSLKKKDFQAVFYALEAGARAYIIP